MISTALVVAATFVLPYLPLHPLLGLVPLPAPVVAWLVGITVLYVLAAEAVKRVFFARKPAAGA
jgi:Mg2+-importing ATPase